jgi:hypothetical protein
MIITFVFFGGIIGSTFEPVAMILLGIGLLGLARSRRKVQRG